ncbi:MAG: hypothetical protein ABS81_08190 [Pseudonocardia sp. SCN 72-86]|nr:MAG: hypothetical protein ABS81_08190 [Pseudonocardia sp. SCN 72-86]
MLRRGSENCEDLGAGTAPNLEALLEEIAAIALAAAHLHGRVEFWIAIGELDAMVIPGATSSGGIDLGDLSEAIFGLSRYAL